MENLAICQSCGMPLDSEEAKGTEKDGQKSNEYCKYCYENGEFIHPKMNLEDMRSNVQKQMKKLEHHEYAIQKAINILPGLNRWKKS
ncbi:zinc ribbon domain-containing protein [Flavobacterium taihuense]|uniref:Zinc ribbon domain-containing protein n=1 Tax=Flavobacterium taihuense TaxID=2857508 RepID=A0ABS6XXI4_9FLAO|nr:zinc ribbon domain-containing protein [Flavobacterium taihuense]MBW4361388.1 zinc ribbon domain-containing protein [Flavobacterium taihuense]